MDSHPHEIQIVEQGQARLTTLPLIGEEPLSIRVQGAPYAVIMRTPGNEKAHVAGFCLGEGIVDSPDDITNIAFCDGEDTNVVTVTLTADRRSRIADHLDRRTYISQTSCGICGKSIVADLVQALSPVAGSKTLDGEAARQRLLRWVTFSPCAKKPAPPTRPPSMTMGSTFCPWPRMWAATMPWIRPSGRFFSTNDWRMPVC